jgi:hypothetical protein
MIHHWSWGIPVRTKRTSHGKVMIFTTDLCLFSSFFMCPFPVSSSIWGYLPSGKHLEKRWEITMFNGKTHSKWPCSSSQTVSLPEGRLKNRKGMFHESLSSHLLAARDQVCHETEGILWPDHQQKRLEFANWKITIFTR